MGDAFSSLFKKVGIVCAVLGVLWLGTGLAVYAWLSDARLTALANHVAQSALPDRAVAVEAVHLSGWRALDIKNLRVGNSLHVPDMKVTWHWMPLLQGQLVVPEMLATGIDVNLEPTPAADSNTPTSPPPPAAPPKNADAPAEPHHFAPPHLPLRVLVRQARVDVERARLATGGREMVLTSLHLTGSFDASTQTLHALGAVALGQAAPGEPSVLTVHQSGKEMARVQQRLTLAITAHDWFTGSVVLRQDGNVHLPAQHLHDTPVHGDAAVHVDLAQGTVAIDRCLFALGTMASVDLAAQVTRGWTAPAVQLERFRLDARLTELMPLVSSAMPGVHVAGEAHAEVQPGAWPLDAAMGNAALEGTVALNHVDVALPQGGVHDVQAVFAVGHGDGVLTASGAFTLQQADSAAAHALAHGLRGTVWVSVATDVNGVAPTAMVGADVQVAVEQAATPQGSVDGASLHAYATGPAAWFQGEEAAPLALTSSLKLRTVTVASAAAHDVVGTLEATVADRRGHDVQSTVGVGIEHTTVLRGQGSPWVLPAVRAQTTLHRRGDAVTVKGAALRVGALVLSAQGTVQHMTSTAPHVAQWQLHMPPVALADLVQLMPPPGVRLETLSGTVQAAMTLDGDVPYGSLAAAANPPKLGTDLDPDDAEAWEAGLRAYAAWARGWAHRFDKDFPFVIRTTVTLSDVNARNAVASVTGLALQSHVGVDAEGPYMDAHVTVPEAPAPTPTPVRGVEGTLAARYGRGAVHLSSQLRVDSAALAGEPTPLEDITLNANARYEVNGDAHIDVVTFTLGNRGLVVRGDGVVEQPLDALATRAWTRAGLSNMRAATHWRVDVVNKDRLLLTTTGPSIAGGVHVGADGLLQNGVFTIAGDLRFDDFSAQMGTQSIEHINGALPAKLALRVGTAADAVPVARNLGWGGGVLSLVSDADDIRDRPARPVYYERLRPYRLDRGIRASHAQSGDYEMTDIALEGRIENGMLLADWIGMNLLGGDVAGNFALQLGRDASVRADMTFKTSNIDASYFPALHLDPGPDSQFNADSRLSLLWAAHRRDFVYNMNVTKMGKVALDRFLRLLDPQGQNASMQEKRRNLRLIGTINQLSLWIRFENINMDISYLPLIRIPGTDIGWRPIERELLRRFSISTYLDLYVQPLFYDWLAPILGWNHAP